MTLLIVQTFYNLQHNEQCRNVVQGENYTVHQTERLKLDLNICMVVIFFSEF